MKTDFPAFELASKTKAFQILLFQHDGFSVHFTKAERQTQSRDRIKETQCCAGAFTISISPVSIGTYRKYH